MTEPIPEVNDTPLPQLQIEPTDLILIARWHHFNEAPDSDTIQRLLRIGMAAPVLAGFNGEMAVHGPSILDRDIEAQVENVPDFRHWWNHVTMNRQPRMSDEPYRFTKLVSERVRVDDRWERRFKVLTGTTPGEANTFTLHAVDDHQLWPWDLYGA